MQKSKILLVVGYLLALAGIMFKIFSISPSLTNSPFPIGWSEGGRIFEAYQVYAQIIDGLNLSWPWLDPGRSILDGLVLLLPNSQIWMYRFWINFLFILTSFLAAMIIVKKAISLCSVLPVWERREKNRVLVLLILWGILFLLQGPIYYHVLLGALGILWFYDPKRPMRNIAVIILCSMWEGLCRVNWFIMPAALAVLFHLLIVPFSEKLFWRYLKWPFVYMVLGGASSFAVYFAFIKKFDYVIPFINPKMDYAYPLYKLWPNTGFIGLIPGISIICIPLLTLIFYVVWKYWRNILWVRLLGIGCVLLVFFLGSVLVSLRAGGGYDFHNFDSLLLLLFICGCFFGLDAITLDMSVGLRIAPLASRGVLAAVLIIPVLFAYSQVQGFPQRSNVQSEQTLQDIRQILQTWDDDSDDHPILFIDQRQLIVYSMVDEIDIFIPYEKIELAEMAMGMNEEYKSRFVEDLENQKFSLILCEILVPWAKRFEPDNFERDWYENNVWVDFVSIPVLRYYYPIYENKDLGIAIYAPR